MFPRVPHFKDVPQRLGLGCVHSTNSHYAFVFQNLEGELSRLKVPKNDQDNLQPQGMAN